MADLLTYWHTLRHLRPIQFYGRAWFRFYRPKPDLSPAPGLRQITGPWVRPASKAPRLLEPMTFRFLNETHVLAEPGDWDDLSIDKLWRYNLHYFDDLNARNAAARDAWHRDLLTRWVAENPPGQGSGWEPYPTSLRIVNWIKWVLAGNELLTTCRQSLAIQARWVFDRLEIHLLGNHLFANAKALVFAGLFFDGAEAKRWLSKGLRILEREIPEQILNDGGQFERSTMYHALTLEDMLDLHNAAKAFPGAFSEQQALQKKSWLAVIDPMRRWLAAMCHPDGEISFFNDAAIGVAPSPAELEDYARRLALCPLVDIPDNVTHLAESGYIRVQQGAMVTLIDAAPVGPEYLPGHAHADTLSFELSLFGQRILVNSGTSCYGDGSERLRQRGTAAHNTVVINGRDSSEVWGGFRVARRARPVNLAVTGTDDCVTVECSHNGYQRFHGKPIHTRRWQLESKGLTIEDRITGRFSTAEARFHFHPELLSARVAGGKNGDCKFGDGHCLHWKVELGEAHIEASTYHPSFGEQIDACCLVVCFEQAMSRIRFSWD